MEDIAADIARAVDQELRHIRDVLGDDANLDSPELDLYHSEYMRLSNGTGTLSAAERHAIWDSICPPDAITLAQREKSSNPWRRKSMQTSSVFDELLDQRDF